jgi:hypothetical protein
MAYNEISWDDLATPVQPEPVIDPNGWHWYPDANGHLFNLYFDADGNECMMWMLQDDGSFYWRCANVGYICRDIGIEDRRGIFFQDHLVGTMILDQDLTVAWLPETYINNITPHDQINNFNIHYNINLNDINLNDINIDNNIENNYDPEYDSDEDDIDP